MLKLAVFLQVVTSGLAAVPVHLPGPLSFYDHDPDAGEIGGVFEFIKASSEVDITHYVTYFGSSSTAKLWPLVNISATGLDPEFDIPMNTAVPRIDGVTATHLLTFSANAEGEGPTGTSMALHDRAVPVQGPAGLEFEDEDYQHGKLGGRVTVHRASHEADVSAYALYFGSGPSSLLSAAAVSIPLPSGAGPVTCDLPNGTVIPTGATHLLAYTWNADGLVLVPAALQLRDRALPDQPATAVAFQDSDLGRGEISGLVVIGRASSELLVAGYAVYFARGAAGPVAALLGVQPSTGADVAFLIPADTPLPAGVTHLLVLTRNQDGQMATGLSTPIVDRSVPVHPARSLAFDDLDLDVGELAGTITVSCAANESDLLFYAVFFADRSLQPLPQAPVANFTKGPCELNHTLEEPTTLPAGAVHLLVLSGNGDGLMAAGASTPLLDRAVPVNPPVHVEFVDSDTDAGELGGSVTVLRSSNEEDVTSYVAYYGTSSSATAASIHSAIGMAAVGGLAGSFAVFPVFPNSLVPAGATHFLAFSRNADGDGRVGISTPIVDRTAAFPSVAVTGISFQDYDPDLGTIGGPVSWLEPSSTLGLTAYTVFLAADATGTLQQEVGSTTSVGGPGQHQTITLPAGTALATASSALTHIIVYTNNYHGRGPGRALPILDRALPTASVGSLSFSDLDPELGRVGGEVRWVAPANPNVASQFTDYAVYFAEDLHMAGRVKQGEVPVGVNLLVIHLGTELHNFTHLAVCTKNDVGEALSCPVVAMQDRILPSAVVERLQFFDQDLGTGELGGSVAWTEPEDKAWVERYVAYLVDAEGRRSLLGEAPVGSSSVSVPFDTALANFSVLAVLAANAVGEALVNTSLAIVDRTVQSCPASIGHGMASSRWRIAAGAVAVAWRLRAVRFFEDALCTHQLPTLPTAWPRRPRQTLGRPFASPPVMANLHELFRTGAGTRPVWANATELAGGASRVAWWSTGGPCFDPNGTEKAAEVPSLDAQCSVGFSWESDSFVKDDGQISGSSGTIQASQKAVHCVEVNQADTLGHYAQSLALQWYDEMRSEYRTLLQRSTAHGGWVQMAYQQVLAMECH